MTEIGEKLIQPKKKKQCRRIKKLMTLAKYIQSIDGEVIDTTNPYELIRFISDTGVVCVVYNGKKGINFSNDTAREIYNQYNKGVIKVDTKKSKFKSEKKKIRKLMNDVKCKNKDIIKYICEEMNLKTLNLNGINNIGSLRDIWKLIKQYEKHFT